jgi:hypothetical protein
LRLQQHQLHLLGMVALPGAGKKHSSPEPRDAGSRSSDNPRDVDARDEMNAEADDIQPRTVAPTRLATDTSFLRRQPPQPAPSTL